MVEEKKCSKCKLIKFKEEFYPNRSRKDGLQIYCKKCAKGYIKLLICEKCKNQFPINHRNIKYRKSMMCKQCLVEAHKIRLTERNKQNAKHITFNKKGYKFDLIEGKYILSHRKIMERHLGRKLDKSEVVHHIDGNRYNNNIQNLFLTNGKGHSAAHRSLELIGYWLVQNNFVFFEEASGTYILTDIKKEDTVEVETSGVP